MLVHTVLFWLKEDLSEAQRAGFVEGLESLRRIQAAEAVHIGTPAKTPERPVIDQSYDFCLTVLLTDLAAHDAYQEDPLHTAFLEEFRPCW
ncbi:MAG: Dabb family protein, partial [Coraliomargarita sp.]